MAWFYIIGFSVIAWGLLSLLASGRAPHFLEVILGGLAVLSCLIAGRFALTTWLYPLTGWITHLHQITTLLAMAVALLTVAATIPVLWWNLSRWVTPLAVAWVLLPSLLLQGVIPGEGGAVLTKGVLTVADTLALHVRGLLG